MYVAGIVGAVGGNDVCGAGVAPNVTLGTWVMCVCAFVCKYMCFYVFECGYV